MREWCGSAVEVSDRAQYQDGTERPRGTLSARRRLAVFTLLGILLICNAGCRQSASPLVQGPGVIDENWYSVTMEGEHVGSAHSVVTKTVDGYETHILVELDLSIYGTPLKTSARHTWTETDDGTAIRSAEEMSLQGETISTTEVDFTGSAVIRVETAGEDTRVTTHEHSSSVWYTPRARNQYVKEQMLAGEQAISFNAVVLGSDAEPRGVRMTYLGQQDSNVLGETKSLSVWHVAAEGSEDQIELWSASGDRVKSTMPMGISTLEVTLASRDVALGVSGEFDTSLLLVIALETTIPYVEDASSVTFLMSTTGQLPLPQLPEAGGQRIVHSDSNSIQITVSPGAPGLALPTERDDPSYLASTALVDFDADSIAEIMRTLDFQSSSPHDVAEELRRFVHHYIEYEIQSKRLPASEIAHQRKGDCDEYAILLASLLRSCGIPARIALGYSYLGDTEEGWAVLWPHAWTQALIEGHWVDLDATERQSVPHAARILTSFDTVEQPVDIESGLMHPALGDNLFVPLSGMIIEVVDVEY